MDTPPFTPDPTVSLGGYEWRLHELLDQLNASQDPDHKEVIRRQMRQVAKNFDRMHPDRPLVLVPYPFAAPCQPPAFGGLPSIVRPYGVELPHEA